MLYQKVKNKRYLYARTVKRLSGYFTTLGIIWHKVWVGGRHQKYFTQTVEDLSSWLKFKEECDTNKRKE